MDNSDLQIWFYRIVFFLKLVSQILVPRFVYPQISIKFQNGCQLKAHEGNNIPFGVTGNSSSLLKGGVGRQAEAGMAMQDRIPVQRELFCDLLKSGRGTKEEVCMFST